MFTIDASVWINADSPSEPGHEVSRAFIDAVVAMQGHVVVPTFLIVEVAATAARKYRNSSFASQFASLIASLRLVTFMSLDAIRAEQAAQLAATHRLRGADAVYAAVALAHNCTLVSLDNEHLTRLPNVLTVLTPAQALAKLNTQEPT